MTENDSVQIPSVNNSVEENKEVTEPNKAFVGEPNVEDTPQQSVSTVQVEQATAELDDSANVAKAKRDILHGNYVEAVSTMASVCANMSKKLGPMAFPLAEAYYVYGSALLELSRVESNVLGDALDKDDKEAGDNDVGMGDKDEDAKEGEDKLESDNVTDNVNTSAETKDVNGQDSDQKSELEVSNHIEKNGDVRTDDKVEVKSDKEAAEENIDEAEEVDDDEEDSEAGEDVSNLQLAWETLDLARLINERHFNELKETETEELQSTSFAWADCLQLLAEVGMEQGQWEQAYSDALNSLSLRKQGYSYNILDSRHVLKTISQSRCLGESHYQLGSINAGKGDYESAVREIQQCMDLLSDCVNIIRSSLSETNENLPDSREQLEKQLKDIESLLPVLKVRITELQSEKRDLDEVREEMKKTLIAVTMPDVSQPPSDDISHLIRKKRPTNVLTIAENNEQNSKDKNGTNVENAGQSPPLKKARVEVSVVEETETTVSESNEAM